MSILFRVHREVSLGGVEKSVSSRVEFRQAIVTRNNESYTFLFFLNWTDPVDELPFADLTASDVLRFLTRNINQCILQVWVLFQCINELHGNAMSVTVNVIKYCFLNV